MARLSLISFLSLILITGFSFKANTNVSENNEFFYSMNTVSFVYAGDVVEGQEGGENEGQEGDSLNCEEGEHEENGECVEDSPTSSLNCEEGEHEENGECVEDSPSLATTCPQGEHEENGECVEDSPSLATTCPQGEHEENGECVEDSPSLATTCPQGEHEENGECVEDSPTSCPQGEHEDNGECVEDSPTSCPQGEHLDNGLCVKDSPTSCPQGEHLDNGLCVKDSPTSCPQGEHLDNGLCVKDSPTSCPQGEHLDNGLCVKDSPTSCPQGEHLDNGLCVKSAALNTLGDFECDEGWYLDEVNGDVCKPCDDHSEEEECKDEEEDKDKDKDKDKDEGSIPIELIKILLNFNQEIDEDFKCNKVKVKGKNVVLCRDAGITQQQIIAQNPLNCPTQTENIPLTGTLEPQGLRLLADLDPCMIKDGSITLNMPNTEDIKVAVMYLDKTGDNHKGALINPGQIQVLSNNQGLFKLDLDQIMMGKDPKTGKITTMTKINGLALYNNGDFLIQFGPSNSVALTAILAQGALSGPYLPGNNIIDNSIRMSDSLSQNPSIPPSTTSSLSPSPSPPSPPSAPKNTTDSSSTSLSLANLNTLDQNQLMDAISSKISQLRNFEKNKISQALFDLTQNTAAKGGDVMKSLRQIGTKILQNPSDPLIIDKIIRLAQTK